MDLQSDLKALARLERIHHGCYRCGERKGWWAQRHVDRRCTDTRDQYQYGQARVVQVSPRGQVTVLCPLEGCPKGYHWHGETLGDRAAHCQLGGYEIVDPYGLTDSP